MFSRTFGYAVRAAVFVAIHSKGGRKIGLQEISDRLGIPKHFLGKIMQELVRQGFLESAKGPAGGFFANERTTDVHVMEILRLTDGSNLMENCVLGVKRCNAQRPCSLHHDFSQCRNRLLEVAAVRTLGQLAQSAESGETFLEDEAFAI